MKRLTPKEAQNYIPLTEDFTNQAASFFTIVPEDDEWDKVSYYSARRIDTYANRGEGDSWVYVMTNDSMPGCVKIGYTKSFPDERAKQLSRSTSVANPFQVAFSFKCFKTCRYGNS